MSEPESEPQTEAEQPTGERPYEKSELVSADSLVLVHTGHGKGKSTAAFGTALRAVTRDWNVAVVQFLKSGNWNTGEEKALRQLGADWYSAGDGFTWDSTDLDETRAKLVAGWEFASELLAAGDHQLLLLDEISYGMTWGWLDATEVAAAVANRPTHVSVILTGRDMADEVIEVADTVTEMRMVKHAFERQIRAKKGIDF